MINRTLYIKSIIQSCNRQFSFFKQAKEEALPEITAEEISKNQLKKMENYKSGGPQLYVSILLNQKGPLTNTQIWQEYKKDKEAVSKEIIPSLTFLKQRVIRVMRLNSKIESAGYSHFDKKHQGWRIKPEACFKYTHPDILVRLDPRPDIPRFQRPDVQEALIKLEQK